MESMGFFAYLICMYGWRLWREQLCLGSGKKNKEKKWMENRVDVICMMLVT